MSEGVIRMCEQEWKNEKKGLRKEIERSKREEWKRFCKILEDDIWGMGYKIAVEHCKRVRTPYEIGSDGRGNII